MAHGYVECACATCFDTAVCSAPAGEECDQHTHHLCSECDAAGCDGGDCAREDIVDEEEALEIAVAYLRAKQDEDGTYSFSPVEAPGRVVGVREWDMVQLGHRLHEAEDSFAAYTAWWDRAPSGEHREQA